MADIGTAYVRIAPNMTGIQGKIAGGLRGSGSRFASQFGTELTGKSAAIIGAIAGVAQAAVTKAMGLVSNSIGDAVARVDTLERFPTVMKNLGYSAKGASEQVNRIAENLTGLPTSLDSLTTFVTRVAPVSGSLKKATDTALAFNNAVLAGGGPIYRQADAIEQFSQMLSKGEPDLMSWRTLQEAMPATLGQIAKKLGIASGDTTKLYEAMKDGKIGFDDFNNAVIGLNKKGLPGFKNFEDQAKDATKGIATGWANMQIAITRGVTKIIGAIGSANISKALADIGNAFESGLALISKAIPPVLDAVGKLFGFIARNKDVFTAVAVGIGAAVVALKTYNAVMAVTKALTAAQIAVSSYLTLVASLQAQGLGVLRAAWMAFNLVLNANPIAIVVTAVAALTAGLVYFFTKTETGKRIFAGFMTFLGGVWEKVKGAIKIAADFLGTAWDASIGAVKTAFEAIKTTAQAVFNAIAGWIEKNRRKIINVSIVIGTLLLPKLTQIGIRAAVAATKAVIAFVKMGASAVKNAVLSSAAWIKSAAKSALAWVKNMPKVIAAQIKAGATGAKQAVIAGAAWIKQAALTSASWLKTFAMYGLGVAKAALQTGLAAIKMAASWLLAMGPIGLIVAAVAGAVALIIANWDKVGPFFKNLWQKVTNIFKSVINWIKGNWPKLLAIITGPIGIAVLLVMKNLNKIKAGFRAAWNFVKRVWSGVIGFFRRIWSGIRNAFGAVVGFFGNIFRRAWQGVKNIWSTVGGFFRGIFNKIKNALSGAANIGKNLVKGIWNGISSLGGWLKDKIIGFVADKIPGPVKKALGISSPSKLFAGFGKNIVQGLSKGIDKNSQMASKSVNNMANKAISAMHGTHLNATGTITPNAALTPAQAGGGNQQTVTIGTIVLGDDSAVREMFKQLNQDTINIGMGITPAQGANK